MGHSKKVTVSYWYKLIAHLGWCKGPIDALLEIRGGDRVAWKGRQSSSGIIDVDKPNLYGGTGSEGGIQGQFEVMMGDTDQQPNPYLAENFGPAQPGYRGRATVVLRGPRIGAGNPYPKSLYFKLERILKGWDNDTCWYPEKAGVPLGGEKNSAALKIKETPFWDSQNYGDIWGPVFRGLPDDSWMFAAHTDDNGPYWYDEGSKIVLKWYAKENDALLKTNIYTVTYNGFNCYRPSLTSSSPDGRWQIFIDQYTRAWLAERGAIRWRIRPSQAHSWDWFMYVPSYINPAADFWWAEQNNGWALFLALHGTDGYQIYKFEVGERNLESTAKCSPVDYQNGRSGKLYWMSVDHQGHVITANVDREIRIYDKNLNLLRVAPFPSAVTDEIIGFGADQSKNLAGFIVGKNGHWRLNVFTLSDGEPVITFTFPEATEDSFHVYVGFAGDSVFAQIGDDFYRADIGKSRGFLAMNPAHILYDSITSRRENGGQEEPVAKINDASFRAAADRFYDERFGLCCTWHGGESAEQFQQRICNVSGVSLSQSRKTGQYYLDLLRETENHNSLPVLTDDDIIEWEAEQAVSSESINQIQVRWFDPSTRETRATTPIQSLGAIEDAGGVLADIKEYYEIPSEEIALRVAQWELNSRASALWKFTITCTRQAFDIRYGQKIVLRCPQRSFPEMVAVVGDIDYGDFSSDEISLVAVQDVFSMPITSSVSPQPGLSPPVSPDPVNISNAVAMEAPYVELAETMSAADLSLLHETSGYLLTGAERPSNGLNYQLATKTGGENYATYGMGDWTPSAKIVESYTISNEAPEINFSFSDGQLLDHVELGTWAVWENEICRVDELDQASNKIKLGRACADTVISAHSAGSKISFLGDWNASDSREYAEGETVYAKLMNRTGQGQVGISVAKEASVTMRSRQGRPYPPGRVRVNGQYAPERLDGNVTLTWAHRDRVSQADKLVDGEQDSIGPEQGTTYTVEWRLNNVLIKRETGITGTSAYCVLPSSGIMSVQLESQRGSLSSWQKQIRSFAVTALLNAEDDTVITDELGVSISTG